MVGLLDHPLDKGSPVAAWRTPRSNSSSRYNLRSHQLCCDIFNKNIFSFPALSSTRKCSDKVSVRSFLCCEREHLRRIKSYTREGAPPTTGSFLRHWARLTAWTVLPATLRDVQYFRAKLWTRALKEARLVCGSERERGGERKKIGQCQPNKLLSSASQFLFVFGIWL